jgi:hypothetical protein
MYLYLYLYLCLRWVFCRLGRVKLSVVGYGRKTQEGGDTLGGRSATELSTNITKLNQALTNDATIRHISLVGCNLDNPTDNSTSAVNHSVSAVFLHLYDGGLCWVLKGKLKGAVFDIVIGFGLD